jgi:cell division protein FtsI (penicillin-binding protein 3)
MSLADALANPLSPLGRWVGRRLWWIEHAFERTRASDKAVNDTRLRIFFVLMLFGAGFVVLSLGATKAALFSRYGHGAEPLVPAPGARADLVDRNGEILAIDVIRYGVYLDPREIVHKSDVRAALLAAFPGLAPAKLDRIFAGDRNEFVVGGLTPEQRQQIHDLALPGVSFEEESGRAYPLGMLGAHLIGFASKDGVGQSGIERAFDTAIRAGGGKTPVALSIDLRVQGALEDELDSAAAKLGAIGGAGIVVNVRTGEILGMASWPSYDPNGGAPADHNVLVNRVAGVDYEPGSVMKIFTLAMGLDSGAATLNSTFDTSQPLELPGQTIHDFEAGGGVLTLSQVFVKSSNIGAAKLGLKAGPQVMERYYRSFGLFNAAPSPLAESTAPILPRALTPNIVASMSFGHAISESPLALATGMSAVLNGGTWRPLTLTPLAAGQAPAAGRTVIQPSTSRTMLDLMRMNVVSGTGTKADVPGLRVGGKTGTATKLIGGHYLEGKNVANLASFAGVFPTDAPFGADRYLVLIMLDAPKANAADGGVTTAALTAAPAAGRVIERIAPFLGVRRVILPADLAAKPAVDPKLLTGEDQ